MPQASASTSQPPGRAPTQLPLSKIPIRSGANVAGPSQASPNERVRF